MSRSVCPLAPPLATPPPLPQKSCNKSLLSSYKPGTPYLLTTQCTPFQNRNLILKMQIKSVCNILSLSVFFCSELTLENFAGVFCVLACGLVLACIVTLIELFHYLRKSNPILRQVNTEFNKLG